MISYILLYTNIAFAIIVAFILGPKRNIGDNWSLFFGLTLSIFFQIAITLSSDLKKNENPRKPHPVGWIVILFGITGLLSFLYEYYSGEVYIPLLLISIGMTGWGIYLAFPSFLRSVNG